MRPAGDAPLLDSRAAFAAYRGALPWVALAWIAAELLPGPPGWRGLILLGASPFFLAGAARSMGLHPHRRGTFALAVERAFSHLSNTLILVAFTALGAAVGGTAGAIAADVIGLADDRPLSIPAAVLAALPILWSRWPAAVLAFAAPEDAGSTDAAGRRWRGPPFGDARRLTRIAGSVPSSALILVVLGIWLALLFGARPLLTGTPATLVDALSFLGFVPCLAVLALVETRRMLERLVGP
jgi:hypothetical protein